MERKNLEYTREEVKDAVAEAICLAFKMGQDWDWQEWIEETYGFYKPKNEE